MSGRFRVAFLLCVAVTSVLMSVLAVHSSPHARTADYKAYERTLTLMHHGADYYDATRTALTEKEGRAPSSVRAIRPPILFEVLYKFPSGAWRYSSIFLIFVSLTATGFLFAPAGRVRLSIATILMAHWVWIGARNIPFHAEFWGLAPALAGFALLRHRRWIPAIACLALATCTRELYGAMFLAGIVLVPKSHWKYVAIGGAAIAAFYIAHYELAQSTITASGYQPPLNGLRNVSNTITVFTFAFTPFWRYIGLIMALVGLTSLYLAAKSDRIMLTLLAYSVVMAILTIVFGREYWGICFGPFFFCAVALARRPQTTAPS